MNELIAIMNETELISHISPFSFFSHMQKVTLHDGDITKKKRKKLTFVNLKKKKKDFLS